MRRRLMNRMLVLMTMTENLPPWPKSVLRLAKKQLRLRLTLTCTCTSYIDVDDDDEDNDNDENDDDFPDWVCAMPKIHFCLD